MGVDWSSFMERPFTTENIPLPIGCQGFFLRNLLTLGPLRIKVLVMRAIQRIRKLAGWSRRTLAIKAGITEETIKNLEIEAPRKTQERIRTGLATALGVTENVIFRKDHTAR